MLGLLLFVLGLVLILAGFTVAGLVCCAVPIVVTLVAG